MTAVLNALRAGLTATQLLGVAPGLQTARLLDAYQTLESVRYASAAAWRMIVEQSTAASLTEHGDAAAKLLPVLIERLRRIAATVPDALDAEVRRAAGAVDAHFLVVRQIEQQLDRRDIDAHSAAEHSRALFGTYGDGAFTDDNHLPMRVGSIVPIRAAVLLGETQPAGRS